MRCCDRLNALEKLSGPIVRDASRGVVTPTASFLIKVDTDRCRHGESASGCADGVCVAGVVGGGEAFFLS